MNYTLINRLDELSMSVFIGHCIIYLHAADLVRTEDLAALTCEEYLIGKFTEVTG